jgi:hypothetical protein
MNTLRPMACSARPVIPPMRTRVIWLVAALAGMVLAGGCSPSGPHIVGLRPNYPGLPSCDRDLCPPFSMRTPRVDRLRPTFRWERFPRNRDLSAVGSSPGERVTDVSYELRLWKVGKEFSGDVERLRGSSGWIGSTDDYKYSWMHECRDTDPGELIYTRRGIRDPNHTVETTLHPASYYYWSIRAHFRLDGSRRVTEWSEQLPRGRSFAEFSDRSCSILATFHLFRTP